MSTKKFTCIAVKWRDRVNGNTYHSVRITRHKDGAVVVAPFQYGYGEQYRQTAFKAMCDAKWVPVRYRDAHACIVYAMENNYPIIWSVSDGLKRECIANGIL